MYLVVRLGMKDKNTMTIMTFNCPLCSAELVEQVGSSLHPGDAKYGVSLHCPSLQCPAQEVAGHGDSAKLAFEVIQDKFKRSKTQQTS